MQSSPIFVELSSVDETDKYLISHAGIMFHTLAQSNPDATLIVTKGQGLYEQLKLLGDMKQIHGHFSWKYVNIEDQLADDVDVINLDSGVVYGDKLTAFNAATKEVIQVDAKKVYAKHN
jgi:hypothetical protein